MYGLILVLALAAGAGGDAEAEAEQAAYEQKILAELRATAPKALADGRAAGEAYAADHWDEAIAAYERVLEQAPRFTHALRRICNAQVALGRTAEAVRSCREALEAAPLPENRVALANALVADPTRRGRRAEAASLARQALAGPPDRSVAVLACEVALKADDAETFYAAVRALRVAAPASIEAHYYSAVEARMDRDYARARSELALARDAGLDPAAVTDLEDAIDRAASAQEDAFETPFEPADWVPLIAWVLLGWAAGMILLLGLGAALSFATSRAALRLARSPAGTDTSGSRGLRGVYGTVLWLTCLYYYASLPLVLLVVVATAGGVLWLLFAGGHVPIKLVLIIALVALVTVWSVLKSLWASVFRRAPGDPGLRVAKGDHPALDRVVTAVAEHVHTRPVDAVFLVPGAEVAVFERGGVARQLAGRAERCLILGAGVLEGMTQGELEAVLAHEYGHLVNRDTAGGGFALAVRRSILTMARALAEGGAATWYNPAWWFVRDFHKVFLRVSQGASRLQEILADRWAAVAYGGATFARGLQHAITQGIRFERHAQAVLGEVIERQGALSNLYRYAPAKPDDPAALEAAVAEAMNAEPSPYDSHPRPRDRIAWTAGIPAARAGIDDGAPAWALFTDREAVERAMTLQIKLAVAANHGVTIPDEPAGA